MTIDGINSRVHDELKPFDDATYLLDPKLILSFFTLQEITAVVQAQLIADVSQGFRPANSGRPN